MKDLKPGPGYLFPGTAIEPSGHEGPFLQAFEKVLTPFLEEAGVLENRRMQDLFQDPSDRPGEDLQAQLLTYAFSCGAARMFEKIYGPPRAVAGYSMGIYAAACAQGAFDFSTGLTIIRKAFECMKEAAEADFLMGGVIGLSEEEIQDQLKDHKGVEIAIRNNRLSFVVTGLRQDVEAFLDRAREEGALHVLPFPVSRPYHHSRLLAGSSQAFALALEDLPLRHPKLPLLSAVDQSLAATREQVADALARNLENSIDWGASVETLHQLGAAPLIEPGPGLSLSKIHRFLDVPGRMVNLKTWARGQREQDAGSRMQG